MLLLKKLLTAIYFSRTVKFSRVFKETPILSFKDVQPSNSTSKTSSLGLQQQRANFDRRFDEKIGHRRRRRGWRCVYCG